MRKSSVFLMLFSLASHFCTVFSAANTEVSKSSSSNASTYISDQEILGTVFNTTEDSHLLKIRVYCNSGDPGDHSVRIWTKNGNNFTLTFGPYLWALPAGTTGWQEFEFPVPLPVIHDVTYFISIGYIPTLSSSPDNPGNQLNISERTSNEGVFAQNGGAILPTTWFISNSKRVEVILSIRFKACIIGSDQEVCYNSRPEVLVQKQPPTGGTGLYTYKWQSSPDSLVWQDIAEAKYASYLPPALVRDTWYRCVVSSGAFGSLNSNPVLMTVLAPLQPGSIGKSQTICYNTAPSLMSAESEPTGGAGLYSYKWQKSTDDLIWMDIDGATDKFYQPGNLMVTSWFRRIVSSGNCDQKISNEVQIKVIPLLDPGVIGSTQTICYNSAPDALTNITSPTGGTGTNIFQWQRSTDNSNWISIPGATNLTYAPPALTVSTWYRRQIVNDTCGIKSSNIILINVNAALSAPTIGPVQEICNNTVPAELIQVTPPAGGTGSYTYQWQSSTDNSNWIDITGATNGRFSPPALTSTAWFRCNVTSGVCGTVSSNSIRILVYPALSAGTIGTSQSICFNETPDALTRLTPPSGADGSFTIQWQSSADNSIWNNIAGAVSPAYSPPAITSNTWYRCSVSSSKCGTANTNVVAITVNPTLTAGIIGTDQTICYNSTPAPLSQVSGPTGGTGTYTYQWQSSADNNTWTNIPSAFQSGYAPGALAGDTWFRRYVSSGDCNAISSSSVHITVNPAVSPGTVGTAQSICYGATPAALTEVTAPSGGTGSYSFQWQISSNNSSWSDIPGAISATFSPSGLTSSTWFRRNVSSGNCAPVNGSSVEITVFPQLTPGSIGSDQSVCNNGTPSGITQISAPAGGTGTYSYQWQSSGDNIVWTNITGATSSAYSPPSLTSSIWYRRIVTSGSCSSAVSNTVHITVYPGLTPGTIGSDQTICYNTIPSSLNQLTAPTGGSGSYSFRWQRSSDNTTWTDISGATSSSYSPVSMTSGAWFHRIVNSGGCTATSNSVHITVFAAFSQAQFHDTKRIDPGTSTSISITTSGGTSPFTVSYSRNGVAQETLQDYTSGSAISTGILSEGTYIYTITSVTDANGCSAQSFGSSIIITASSGQTAVSNIALVLVNSSSSSYSNYSNYIQPYLDNFGIPYEVCNVNNTPLPDLTKYAVIIFGHKNVYQSGYPISALENAISTGTGLYSFDPHLFDFSSDFNILTSDYSISSNQINIPNYSHYITQLHAPDSYSPSNNLITLQSSWNIHQNSDLTNAVNLATMTSGGQTVDLLQVANYGSGRIVKWCGYDWVFETILGPVYGMDDLIWRGIVWAARKPFAMQGMPPILTFRMDDVEGNDGGATERFIWVRICNNYGLIPWLGTYNNSMRTSDIPTLKSLIDADHATASPHAFGGTVFIYFNHNGLSSFDPAANVRAARDFYIQNGLKMSKYAIPHYYEMSSLALGEMQSMGIEYIGTHMLPDNLYNNSPNPPTHWLRCGPYRINRDGLAQGDRPVYYGDYVNLNGYQFFNCLTEIRDDGGYEWFPDSNVDATIARGIRHLRRAFNSMVLASLFTHEYYLSGITTDQWTAIISGVTSNVSGYNPEYRSMDYAMQYIRAKHNIRITDLIDSSSGVEIHYSGSNDMATKCYLFDGSGDQISFQYVGLPQINGSNVVSVSK